jgi:hypothetical protein
MVLEVDGIIAVALVKEEPFLLLTWVDALCNNNNTLPFTLYIYINT